MHGRSFGCPSPGVSYPNGLTFGDNFTATPNEQSFAKSQQGW
jgi:hypothetical protein